MSLSGGKKNHQSHLFVVKGENSFRKTEVVGADKLTPEQAQLIKEYEILAGLKGKCVGAVVTGREWDLRPLHFDNGIIRITRFSDPSEKFHLQGYNSLYALFIRLASALPGQALLSHGADDGQLWLTRRFFNTTLGESQKQFSALTRQEQLSKALSIISLIKKIHAEGIFHGHINLNNLAFDGENAVLLDYGFLASDLFKANFSDVAPEIKAGGMAGCAADIHGLGLVLASLFDALKMSDEIDMIEKMIQESPVARPDISKVYDLFASKVIANEITASVSQTVTLAPEEPVKKEVKEKVSSKLATGMLFNEPLVEKELAPVHLDESSKNEVKRSPVRKEESVIIARSEETFSKREKKNRVVRKDILDSMHHTKKIAYGFTRNLQQFTPKNLQTSGLLSIVICAALYMVFFYNRPGNVESAMLNDDSMSISQKWNSTQPSLMRQVALAALRSKDLMAQSVIVHDILKGNTPARTHASLIKAVFDPRWEGELTEDDRLIGLRLGLASLVPEEAGVLPPLNNAHPGVILAILGNIGIAGNISQFQGLAIENLFNLPTPYGETFRELKKLGVVDLNDSSVRAYAHLVMGDVSLENVSTYFGKYDNDLTAFKKLRIILPHAIGNPQIESNIYTYLLINSKLFASMYRWFDEEPLASWDKISRTEKMYIVAGLPTQNELSFEQYTDLLKYANPKIRSESAAILSKKFYDGKMKETLTFMSSKENNLTRAQTIAILAAFPLKGQAASGFYTKWFGQSPDPQSVLKLLISRPESQKDDVFNFEAANYLSKKEWTADLTTLKKLVSHQETLARALAYSKLDKSKAEELSILRGMAIADPNSKLREFITERLSH